MSGDDRDSGRDEPLARLLARWEPPIVPEGLDERMLEAYRRRYGLAPPRWRRLLTGTIRVPVPVAIAVALLLVVAAALALHPVSPPPTAVSPSSSGPVQAAQQTTPIVSGTSLAGFQPVTEVTATVVREGTP